MADLLDRGDSYRVEYLGTAMLTHMSTGLGILQKPLRELYFRHRQSGGQSSALPQRHLRMTNRGMAMSWQTRKGEPPVEEFYDSPSILFWDSIQFATVKGGDKKVRGAFEPLDNDHSRTKDNLFAVLEKKWHFLGQLRHPPVFACVLRRTQGIKALDLHAFVCRSEDEAIGLVRALNGVHENYSSGEQHETGVFGYSPFGKESARSTAGLDLHHSRNNPQPAVGGGGRGSGERRQAHSRVSQLAATPGQRPPPSPHAPLGGSVRSRLSGSQPNLAFSGNGEQRVFQLTQGDFVNSAHSQQDVRQDTQAPQQPHVGGTYDYIGVIPRTLDRPAAARGQHGGEPDLAGAAHTVYTSTLGQREAQREPQDVVREYGSISRTVEVDDRTLSPNNSTYANLDDVTDRRGSPTSDWDPDYSRRSEAAPLAASTPARTGQGYGLLSGSNGPPPGYAPREGRSHGFEYGYQPGSRNSPSSHSRLREGEPPPDGSAPSRHGESPAQRPRYAGSQPVLPVNPLQQPLVARPPRGPSPTDTPPHPQQVERTKDEGDVYARPQKKSSPFTYIPLDPQPLTSWDANISVGERGDAGSESSRGSSQVGTPTRPVAKVTPHKVQGGVRVLPPSAVTPKLQSSSKAFSVKGLKKKSNINYSSSGGDGDSDGGGGDGVDAGSPSSTSAASPARRPHSAYYDDTDSVRRELTTRAMADALSGNALRKAKSQHIHDRTPPRGKPASGDKDRGRDRGSNKTQPPSHNWQFGASPVGSTRSGQDTERAGEQGTSGGGSAEDGTVNEKLLLNKKKDAEIASVLQNLHFDYESNTLSPHGTNFEKSLGYFP